MFLTDKAKITNSHEFAQVFNKPGNIKYVRSPSEVVHVYTYPSYE